MCLSPLCCPGRFIGQACFTCPSLRSGVESAHLTTTTDKREGVIHLEEGRQNLQMTTMESVLKRPAGLTSSTCSTYRRGNWVAGMLSPESSEVMLPSLAKDSVQIWLPVYPRLAIKQISSKARHGTLFCFVFLPTLLLARPLHTPGGLAKSWSCLPSDLNRDLCAEIKYPLRG